MKRRSWKKGRGRILAGGGVKGGSWMKRRGSMIEGCGRMKAG